MNFARKSFTPISGLALCGITYLVANENRRIKTYRSLQASYRISNLVTTVGTIVVDYGISINFPSIEKQKISIRLNQLNQEVERLQQELELIVIKLGQAKKESDINRYHREMVAVRSKLDEVADVIALETEEFRPLQDVHNRSAIRLRDMCAQNLGVYIKLGQHIAMLDHVFPEEYQHHLSTLLANTPQTNWDSVRRVLREDLGEDPEQLFAKIEHEPIASASLAQVSFITLLFLLFLLLLFLLLRVSLGYLSR